MFVYKLNTCLTCRVIYTDPLLNTPSKYCNIQINIDKTKPYPARGDICHMSRDSVGPDRYARTRSLTWELHY